MNQASAGRRNSCALAMNVTVRQQKKATHTGSKVEVWFGSSKKGPSWGTFRWPRAWCRNKNQNTEAEIGQRRRQAAHWIRRNIA